MIVSKHLHSCLLVKEQGKTLLIDPGIFTYQEKALETGKIDQLDYLLITHEHPDHFFLPFVKELTAKFPNITIITNLSLVKLLQNEDIKASDQEDEIVKLKYVPHEKLWDAQPPENIMVTVFGKLSSPGDSHHFDTTADVLALPLIAPWGSMTDAIQLALRLKPKIILPIHDWMYRDSARQMTYLRLKDFFETKGIDFKTLETGEAVEV